MFLQGVIFTDFQHSTWWRPTSCWTICEYQNFSFTWKVLMSVGSPNIIFGINVFIIFLCFKICFTIDNHCKRWNVFSDLLKTTCIFWTLFRVCMCFSDRCYFVGIWMGFRCLCSLFALENNGIKEQKQGKLSRRNSFYSEQTKVLNCFKTFWTVVGN